MCGIVGYIGRSDAVPILLDGLRRLEYRGYDSAGVAILNGGGIEVRKRSDASPIFESDLGKSAARQSRHLSHALGHAWRRHE